MFVRIALCQEGGQVRGKSPKGQGVGIRFCVSTEEQVRGGSTEVHEQPRSPARERRMEARHRGVPPRRRLRADGAQTP
jgi:hypothetical protein